MSDWYLNKKWEIELSLDENESVTSYTGIF